MSKAWSQVLARVALPARPWGGFHNPRQTVRFVRMRGGRRQTTKTAGTEAHDLAGIPKLAYPRRQCVADDGGDARRADERARPRCPVRGRDAEALVGEQHDADVRGLLPEADSLVPVGFQD